MKRYLPLFFMLASLAGAQTTRYTISTGATCTSAGPENCWYHPTGVSYFATGDPWTQLVVSGTNADYCFNWESYQPTAVWTVTDVPELGDTAKLFELNCPAQNLNRLPDGNLHAKIYAFSYVVQVRSCSRSGCRTTNRVEWAVLDNSFVEKTQ